MKLINVPTDMNPKLTDKQCQPLRSPGQRPKPVCKEPVWKKLNITA